MELAYERGHAEGERFAAERRIRPSRRASLAHVTDLLEEMGYEPARVADGVRLGNCPFGAIAEPPYLVCGINKSLLDGALAGARARLRPVHDHVPGHCCVVVRPAGGDDAADPGG
jgi:predicted ArsR family transcriptional regulator